MHIAVINQYHNNPDCAATGRHYSFLEHLTRRHRVSLITSEAWRDQRLTAYFPWVPEGVELHAFEVPYANRMGRVRRALSFGEFGWHAFREGLKLEKPDVIWGVSTPLSAAWVAGKVAKRRKIPWVFEVQDLWPSFPVEMGAIPGKWLQKQLFSAEKQLYDHASHIVTLSPDMTDYVVGKGINPAKVSTILNGTDFPLIEACPDPESMGLRSRYNLGDRQVVLYAGTYGRANAIPWLVEVARLLQHRQDICFVFTGDGYYTDLLEEAARLLPSVVVVPPQPRQYIFAWFRLASLSLVPFLDLPVLHTNSPAKLYDSLAVGTPVVVTNPGWTKALVERHGCGWYSPSSDAPALAATIVKALDNPSALAEAGKRGQDVARELFDREPLAANMQSILEKAAQKR